VVQAAVVAKKQQETMELMIPDVDHDESPAGAFLDSGTEGVDRKASRSVSVSLIEARQLLEEAKHPIDLIKIDAEGYEFQILTALEEFVRKKRPVIFVEVLRRTPQLRKLLISLCKDCGYLMHAIGRKTLHAISPDDLNLLVLQEIYRTRDVVLTPPGFIIHGEI
jgi:hypothetical protein